VSKLARRGWAAAVRREARAPAPKMARAPAPKTHRMPGHDAGMGPPLGRASGPVRFAGRARAVSSHGSADTASTTLSGLAMLGASGISRRVAVIGGGSAGMTTARFLRKAGHEPVIFEAGEAFGGVWADRPTNDVVYKGLQTNLPTVVMQSPDLDFPPDVPSYVTKKMLGDYIDAYGRAFGLHSLTKFGAEVTRVTPTDSTPPRWRVEWSSDCAAHSDVFDAVVVASGHYNEPYLPSLPGEADWLAGDTSRSIMHSLRYTDPEEFRGKSVLVVGGRASGVDIARMLYGVASWVYVLEKKCTAAVTHSDEAVTHVPVGTRLCRDGRLATPTGDGGDGGDGASGSVVVDGPPVERVVLATGYLYAFPFLDETECGMTFAGERSATPLYQHIMHASKPTLAFVGIPLSVPCPIPFFECQAAYLAEQWSRPDTQLAAPDETAEREKWVASMRRAVGNRSQDLHYTSTGFLGPGTYSAWKYMRKLLCTIHAARPPAEDAESWLERPSWEARLETVEAVYNDRGSRYPTKPWHDDAYRRCEYSVDWASGKWTVDDSRAQPARGRKAAQRAS